LACVQGNRPDAPLVIVSRTDFFIKKALGKLGEWEDRGWLDVPNATYLRALIGQMRARNAPTYFRKAKSPLDKQNLKQAIEIGSSAQHTATTETVIPKTPSRFDLTGMRLTTTTQARAYRGIRALVPEPPRRTTEETIEEIIRAKKQIHNKKAYTARLWTSLRHDDIRLTVSDFLWKALHGAHRCGVFWSKIPGLEERALCAHCKTTDSLEHILVKCGATGQNEIWNLTRNLWTKSGFDWPNTTYIEALTFGLRRWKRHGSTEEEQSASRLWRILISESLYLIWKLRCERVIEHEGEIGWAHPAASIQSRWLATMNSRLLLDREMTRPRRAHRSIPEDLVQNTWKCVLQNKDNLPKEWHKKPWVLVGIATPWP
ncbi:hypothetical protein FOMPIDRAFT_1128035, partial [Fomitopsis schrenkii]